MTRFLLVRHASCAPVGRSLAGRLPGVHLDSRGRRQAERLSLRLGALPVVALYSSPRERALETAAPLARRLGLEVRRAERLDEVDVGAWAGRTFAELDADPGWRRWNAERSVARPPGGESALEVAGRALAEVEELRGRHPGEWIALVTHQDVIRTLVAHLLGVPLDLALRLEIAPASVSVVDAGDGGARVLALNWSEHPEWAPSSAPEEPPGETAIQQGERVRHP